MNRINFKRDVSLIKIKIKIGIKQKTLRLKIAKLLYIILLYVLLNQTSLDTSLLLRIHITKLNKYFLYLHVPITSVRA